jgi:hypothetical protein
MNNAREERGATRKPRLCLHDDAVKRWAGKRAGKTQNLSQRASKHITLSDDGHGERDENCARDASKPSETVVLGISSQT